MERRHAISRSLARVLTLAALLAAGAANAASAQSPGSSSRAFLRAVTSLVRVQQPALEHPSRVPSGVRG